MRAATAALILDGVPARSRRLLAAAAILGVAAAAVIASRLPPFARLGVSPQRPPVAPAVSRLPRLDGGVAWLNRDSFAPESLSGHAVVLALWTDTDPRSLDDLPQVQGWWQAYARYGVWVLGVHSPEYAFAEDSSVATRVARRLHLTFPIALDPNYRIRVRLGDQVEWPGFVVADPAGRIVVRAPSGRLALVDRTLRRLIREAHPELGFPTEPEPEDEPPAPEPPRFVPLGTARVAAGPLVGASPGQAQTFTTQFRFQEEGLPFVPYPVGRWIPGAEGLTAERGGAANFVAIRSQGERVGAVIGPGPSGPSRVWVLSGDGWLQAPARGDDIRLDSRGASYLLVTEPRLYEIAEPGEPRVLRFSPEAPGVTFYAFTFQSAGSRTDGGTPPRP
jgi:hypothetical protein